MADLRLGDVIDDWCVKCRRLTNHSVVSIVYGAVAKVRCRTCYHDHDYRHEEPPPSRKDLKKQALFDEVLANMHPDAGLPAEDAGGGAEDTAGVPEDTAAAPEEPAQEESAPEPERPTVRKKHSRKARSNA